MRRTSRRTMRGVVASLAPVPLLLLGLPATASEPPKPDPLAGHGGVSTVDEANGDYTYAIAFKLPSFYDITPQPSLNYSSAGGNGYVGVGWSLGGFGQIVRGAPSRWGSPSFGDGDTFQLNGSLLVSCASLGTPAHVPSCEADRADGNVDHVYYATQIESYGVVYLDRGAGVNGGHGQWVTIDRNGTRRLYTTAYIINDGKSPNSVYKWLETTISDAHNNTVTLQWAFNLFGDCCAEYPTSITYHYPAGPVTVAEFLWERRTDIETIALPGNSRRQVARLKAIDIASPEGKPQVAHDLSYVYSQGTGRSLLTGVTVLGKDRVRNGATAVATGSVAPGPAGALVAGRGTHVFDYLADPANNSFTGDAKAGKPHYDAHSPYCEGDHAKKYTGDFNGDGRTDLLCYRADVHDASRLTVSLSNGTGWTDASWGDTTDFCFGSDIPLQVADFNGDGKDDLACATYSVATVLSDGTKFVPGPLNQNACPTWGPRGWHYYLAIADYNGDGWADLGCHFENNFYVARGWDSDGDGAFDGFEPGPKSIPWGPLSCQNAGLAFGDFNGDGAQDVYCAQVISEHDRQRGSIRVHLSNAVNGFTDAGDWNVATPSGSGEPGEFCTSKRPGFIQMKSLVTGDFNSDGKTDLMCYEGDWSRPGRGDLQVALSTGTRPGPATSWGSWAGAYPSGCEEGRLRAVGDVDGDGRTDIGCLHINVDQGADHTFVRRSTGTAFAPHIDWKQKWCTDARETFLDVNGDGKNDLVCPGYRPRTGLADEGYKVALAGGAHGLTGSHGPIDLLERITTPAGGTLAIGYAPASSFSNAFGTPSKGPVVTVVKQLDNQRYTDVKTAPATLYSYSGSRYDRIERRSLGYFEVTVQDPRVPGDTDPTAGPVTITEYLQDYGSLSRPVRVRRLDRPGGDVLTIDRYSYWVNGSLPYQSHTADEWHTTCAPGQGAACANRKQKHVSFCAAYDGEVCARTYHDNYGNSTAVVDYGLDGVNPPAALTNVTTYAVAVAGANQRSKAAEVSAHQGAGSGGPALTKVRYSYDGLAPGQVGPLGERKRVEAWLDTSAGYVTMSQTEHDQYGRVKGERDALGGLTSHEYDGYSRRTRTTNAMAQDTEIRAFDPNCNHPAVTVDINDQVSTIGFDGFCRLASLAAPGSPTRRYTYHNVGAQTTNLATTMRFKSAHDLPGAVQEHSEVKYLDGLGREYQTKVVAARPASASNWSENTVIRRTSWDARGNVAGATVPAIHGDTTTYSSARTYDALNRVVSAALPGGGATTTYQYDVVDPAIWGSGVWSARATDPLGTPSFVVPGVQSSGAFAKHCEYVAAAPGGAGGAWHCRKETRDLLGRVVQVHEPDKSGSPTVLVGSSEYDSLSRSTRAWDAARGDLHVRYDLLNNPRRTLDARGTLTCFEYDALGRVTRKRTVMRSGVTPAALTDATPCGGAGDSVETAYDVYPAGVESNLTGTFYNAGKVTMIVARTGDAITSKRSFGYDQAGRQVATALEVDGKVFRRSMTYDAGGMLASMTLPDGDVIAYTHDNQGNVIGMSASGTPIARPTNLAARADWQYDAAGRLQYLELGNGTIRRSPYHPARGWLSGVKVTRAGQNLLTYGYDAAHGWGGARNALGLVTSIASSNSAAAGDGTYYTDHTGTITYDSQYRMTGASGDGTALPWLTQPRGKWSVSMSYNPSGEVSRRTAELSAGAGAARPTVTPIGLVGNYCYSGTNRHAVTSVVEPGRDCQPGTWPQGYTPPSFTYDAAGNMLTHRSSASTIAWNADGRPVQMTIGGVTQSNTYDGEGRRIKATTGGATTYFDDDFEWSQATGSTKHLRFGNLLVARRVAAGWAPPAPRAAAATPTWTTQFLYQNHLGSVVMVADSQGAVSSRAIYTPWGERIAGSRVGGLGFTGEREDDTGLMFLRARYYDPTLSRFLSADPVVPGKALGHLDRYAYAGNNPLHFVDPSGHESDPTTPAPPMPEDVMSWIFRSQTAGTPIYGSNTWAVVPGGGWGIWRVVDEQGTLVYVPFTDAVLNAGVDPNQFRSLGIDSKEVTDFLFALFGERAYGQGEQLIGILEEVVTTDILAAVCQIHDVQFEFAWAQAHGANPEERVAGRMSLEAMLPDLLMMWEWKKKNTSIIVDGAVFDRKAVWAKTRSTTWIEDTGNAINAAVDGAKKTADAAADAANDAARRAIEDAQKAAEDAQDAWDSLWPYN